MPDKLNASVSNDGGVFILRAAFLILNVILVTDDESCGYSAREGLIGKVD
ncbi:hypothetical protein ECTW14301_3711 [Escherichia coli TW14301]|nr:hypothetical protein ECTW14301_3711 [Escherichia coli TW14301]EKW54142.1 hypothetical protein EC960932_3957 [Escherichia coli 96.0932]ELW10618.1 hypothetical protein EC71982_3528 [Escherichia coli 7.1982]ERE32315.1 hypothetical protein B232_3605 [Escherichia coli Tx1686]